MQYKILVVKNRYKKNPNFSKGLDWFKKNTPLEMVMTDHIETNFDVTSQPIGNATHNGVIVGDDIIPKLRTVVPQNKYHLVVFLYGNDLNGIRLNAANPNPIWPGTYMVQICTDTDKGKKLNHEIFHSFFQRLRPLGINLIDPMDIVYYNGAVIEYFNNDDLDAVPSNRSIAMGNLAPYWDKVAQLAPVMTPPTPPVNTSVYKWFKMNEPTGRGHTFSELDPKLRAVLDACREKAGVPFVITSGFRTVAENKEIGGVSNSSHLRGLAADILCTDNTKRTAMLRGILNCGTPVFLEVAKKHLHIDIDATIHPMGGTMVDPNDE